MIAVKTKDGLVTSIRADDYGWIWRIDEGQPAHDFGTVEAAQEWIAQVWERSTQKERDEAGWTVEEVAP